MVINFQSLHCPFTAPPPAAAVVALQQRQQLRWACGCFGLETRKPPTWPARPAAIYVSRPPAVKFVASRQPAMKTNAAKPPRKSRLAAIFLSTFIRERQKYKVLQCKKIWCSVFLIIKLKLERIQINWSIDVHSDNPEGSETHYFVSPTVRF